MKTKIVLLACAVPGIWILNYLVVVYLYWDIPEPGQFGDIFGASNSLFAGLGLAAVALTIIQQQDQLRQNAIAYQTASQLAVLPSLIEEYRHRINHRNPAFEIESLNLRRLAEIAQDQEALSDRGIEVDAILAKDVLQLIAYIKHLEQLYASVSAK